MATVYLAQDLKHGRPVALKVLRPALSMSMGPDRFRREITTAARLQHPHILSVHDSGETEGLLWYTMPYVRGESLKERLKREGRLPLEDAVRITAEAGRGWQGTPIRRQATMDERPCRSHSVFPGSACAQADLRDLRDSGHHVHDRWFCPD